jgi:hypothetical protein
MRYCSQGKKTRQTPRIWHTSVFQASLDLKGIFGKPSLYLFVCALLWELTNFRYASQLKVTAYVVTVKFTRILHEGQNRTGSNSSE